jgi:hypothetical protein
MATVYITNAGYLIEPLKRAIAPPGGFDDAFPDADDDTLFAYITDAFGEARIDGFFLDGSVDWVTGEFDPEISQAEAALLVIYASMNILTTQIRNTGTRNKYVAGPVQYETEFSAGVLQAALASMEARKKQLLQSTNSAVPWFGDAYVSRLVCNWHWFEEEGV